MQPVANLANTQGSKIPAKILKPWHMGTHLRELQESYPMNPTMTRCYTIVRVHWTKEALALEGFNQERIWLV